VTWNKSTPQCRDTAEYRDDHSLVDQVTSFLILLNASQTTNRQSYRATVYKTLMMKYWYAFGMPFRRSYANSFPAEEKRYFNRFMNRYLDIGRCFEIKGKYYPSQDVTELVANICRESQADYRYVSSQFGIALDPTMMETCLKLTLREEKNLQALSGQLIRVELALWEKQLARRHEIPLNTKQLSRRTGIVKSTLSNLLDSAKHEELINATVDEDDGRVTRWSLNHWHPRTTSIRSILRSLAPGT